MPPNNIIQLPPELIGVQNTLGQVGLPGYASLLLTTNPATWSPLPASSSSSNSPSQVLNTVQSMLNQWAKSPLVKTGANVSVQQTTPTISPESLDAFNQQMKILEEARRKYDEAFQRQIEAVDEENRKRDISDQITSNKIIYDNPYAEDLINYYKAGGKVIDYSGSHMGINPLYPGSYVSKAPRVPPPKYEPPSMGWPSLPVAHTSSGLSVGASIGPAGYVPKTQTTPSGLPVPVLNVNSGAITNDTYFGGGKDVNLSTLYQLPEFTQNASIRSNLVSNFNSVFSDGKTPFLGRKHKLTNIDISVVDPNSPTPKYNTQTKQYDKEVIPSLASWILGARLGVVPTSSQTQIALKVYLEDYNPKNKAKGIYIYADKDKLLTKDINNKEAYDIVAKERFYVAIKEVVNRYLEQNVGGGKTLLQEWTEHVVRNNPDLVNRFTTDPNATASQARQNFVAKFPIWLSEYLTALMFDEAFTQTSK